MLIVARDRVHLYEFLQHAYRDSETITVLLGRRRNGRRCHPTIDHDLRLQPYVLVRPHSRRPHD